MAERQFGPYVLVHQIAVGGMAEIHLAKTSGIAGFEKYVALKMIHPNFSQDQQFIQMLIDEAKITVHLQHVNIAQTFDLGRVADTYYITMEYVDGADLYKLLRKGSEQGRHVPVPVAAYVAKEVATGLDYAHRKRDVSGKPLGIVHRDVSPQNVLISYAGEVKLVDFGIAKATMRARQTQAGVIKGKYYYMSPEQAWGDHLDHRTDVFSTGILLYEMLTGQMLYLEDDLHKLLEMVRRADIGPPTRLRADIPPQLERIVMHALAKRADDRYQTAADLATDLERFLRAHAPIFTSTRIAAWMNEILSAEAPPPSVPAPEPVPVAAHRETQRLTRDQLVVNREDLPDENSVIFNVESFRDAGQRIRAAQVEPAAAGEIVADDGPTRGLGPKDVTALATGAGPRAPHIPTREIQADLSDLEADQTVLSEPPGFGGLESAHEQTVVDASPFDDSDEGETLKRPRLPLGQSMGADGGGAGAADGLDAPTVKSFSEWEDAPALAASISKPAVSAIHPPRPSRKTPGQGLPGASVLSELLYAPGRAPKVAIAGPPGGEPGPPAGAGPFPVPAPAPGQPGPGQSPAGFPAVPPISMTRQLAAIELDEIPDAYKIQGGRGSKRVWFWGTLAFLVCLAGAGLGVYGLSAAARGDQPATIVLISSPPGARVTVNGEALEDRTPTSYARAIKGKKYLIAFDLPRHERLERETVVPVEGGDRHEVIVQLQKLTVRLEIESQPPGASIYVNGSARGVTPLVLPELDPAEAQNVELRLRGYQPVRRNLDWDLTDSTQRTARIEIALEPQQ